jgi:type II secretory pathway pseudopilin PulG
MINRMASKLKVQKNQDGLVAIVVVSFIIIILALMTLGFAKVMDRELKQSVDRALASQANYAAESGINDAREYIKTILANGGDPTTNGCLNIAALAPFAPNGNISGNNVTKYSCIIIDAHPKELVYNNLARGDSRVFKVILNPGDTLDNLFFSWENNQIANGCVQPFPGSPHALPQESAINSCTTGMLRVSIYPVPNNINLSANINDTLAAASRSYFLYPNGGAGLASHAYGGPNGDFIDGNCNAANRTNANLLPYKQSTPRYCNSQVSGLSGSNAAYYYVRITALYQNLSVSIQGSNSSNSSISLGGSEAVVDVTGEGNDTLKRLQARVPLEGQVNLPEYGLQSLNTVCKRLRLPLGPGGPTDYQAAIIEDGPGASDPAECQPQL